MMEKWAGKYDVLYANLVKKYGPLGSPLPVSAAAPGAGGKKFIGDFKDSFVKLVSKAAPTDLPSRTDALDVVKSKAGNAANGLETSTFTVCSRVRPILDHEKEMEGGENFAVVLPGQRYEGTPAKGYTEEMLACTPKVGITGKPKLETAAHEFDYAFGPESNNKEIYKLTTEPLVERCLNGQVGVVFAYGQTGSGKTHTMNGIMDEICESGVFRDGTEVEFSYLEMLGSNIKDCLNSAPDSKPVAIGEALDGRILTRNVTSHKALDSDALKELVERAKALRTTAATEKVRQRGAGPQSKRYLNLTPPSPSQNSASSRAHGIGIISCTDVSTGITGKLYIIDLAGSESAKDSKKHDKARMSETKQINLSLSNLKECIRARTMASEPGMGGIHVPYRRNKLTLLIKDVFEVGCARLCSTVVMTNVSPMASDVAHSSNTLKYSAPLRVAVGKGREGLQRDQDDPANWSREEAEERIRGKWGGEIEDVGKVVGGLNGVQLCALPEREYLERGGMEGGKKVYLWMWEMITDAKTRRRRDDGSIITKEDEEREREELIKAKEEKARVWAEREKHLRKEF